MGGWGIGEERGFRHEARREGGCGGMWREGKEYNKEYVKGRGKKGKEGGCGGMRREEKKDVKA